MVKALQVFGVEFAAMASRCEVRLAAGSEKEARALAQPAIDEVRRIEHKYSRYRADSIVSQVNAAAGLAAVPVDEETASLFAYAEALYQFSGGLFDITSGVLRRGWDFHAAALPSEATLAPLLSLIGWRRVERTAGDIFLPQAGMEIDFGGFGKEYAADRALAMLGNRGVTSGYVNLGGDMAILGPQPDGRPWMMGIQHPREDSVLATLPVSRGGLATSGDYERFFELQGRRYCHVLDPRSGQPVTYWRSVSVLGPLTVAAGSLATIAMLKQEAALDFLDGAGVAYLAVDHTGAVHRKEEPAKVAAR